MSSVESPLEILSRAALMSSSAEPGNNGNNSGTLNLKRGRAAEGQGASGGASQGGKEEEEEDHDQPLDFSVKKRRSTTPPSVPAVPVPTVSVGRQSPPLVVAPSSLVSLRAATSKPPKKRFTKNLESSTVNSNSPNSSDSEEEMVERKFVKRKSSNASKKIKVDKSRRVVVITTEGKMGGSVDEHFRRSLPELFSSTKSEDNQHQQPQRLDNKPRSCPQDDGEQILEPLSVDDHFAKALGPDWDKRISSNNHSKK